MQRSATNDAVDSLLAGYEGYLVADAHVVYDHLYERGDIVEVNCWAHSRRYFFKAMASDPERAGQALRMQGLLFKIERSIKDREGYDALKKVASPAALAYYHALFAAMKARGGDILSCLTIYAFLSNSPIQKTD